MFFFQKLLQLDLRSDAEVSMMCVRDIPELISTGVMCLLRKNHFGGASGHPGRQKEVKV